MFLQIEVESVIADYAGVAQLLDVEEVLLEFQIMLLVHAHPFNGVDFSVLYVLALKDRCVAALAYLLKQPIVLVKCVEHALFFLLVLIRKLTQKSLRLEAIHGQL
jgi:hypothetical protein